MNDLLAAAKASGINTLDTKKLLQKLITLGYSLNEDSIVLLLQDNPFVESANETAVNLRTTQDEYSDNPVDNDIEMASQMASSSAKKGLA